MFYAFFDFHLPQAQPGKCPQFKTHLAPYSINSSLLTS